MICDSVLEICSTHVMSTWDWVLVSLIVTVMLINLLVRADSARLFVWRMYTVAPLTEWHLHFRFTRLSFNPYAVAVPDSTHLGLADVADMAVFWAEHGEPLDGYCFVDSGNERLIAHVDGASVIVDEIEEPKDLP